MSGSTDKAVCVAALYVDPEGVYAGLEGVDVWDEARDARLYAGPWPVVAHPPCNRWSLLAMIRPHLIGQDSGCFAAALEAVRRFGGVLEHPAYTLAWRCFGLPRPPGYGWGGEMFGDGWVCQVDQGLYGHEMRKLTWLYAVGCDLPQLRWGDGGRRELTVRDNYGGGPRQAKRSATPAEFRDVLLELARSARIEVAA
jgi:hypothetical protein